jgi:hypothetical protein
MEGGVTQTDEAQQPAVQMVRHPAGLMSSLASSAAAEIIGKQGFIPGIGVAPITPRIIPGIGASTNGSCGGTAANAGIKKEVTDSNNEGILGTAELSEVKVEKKGKEADRESTEERASTRNVQGGALEGVGKGYTVVPASGNDHDPSGPVMPPHTRGGVHLSVSSSAQQAWEAVADRRWELPDAKRQRLHPGTLAGEGGRSGRGRGAYWAGGRDSYQPSNHPSSSHFRFGQQGGYHQQRYAGRAGPAPAAAYGHAYDDNLRVGGGPVWDHSDVVHYGAGWEAASAEPHSSSHWQTSASSSLGENYVGREDRMPAAEHYSDAGALTSSYEPSYLPTRYAHASREAVRDVGSNKILQDTNGGRGGRMSRGRGSAGRMAGRGGW